MKTRLSLRTTALIVAVALITALRVDALTIKQTATAAKLGAVQTGFGALWFFKSYEYIWNWQLANGTSKTFPTTGLSNDVLLHLQKQRAEIVKSVTTGVKNGAFKQGKPVRVQSDTSGMLRPATINDFTYSIGGCTIPSYADVSIGVADSKGKITCTIKKWGSTLTDVYKFDKGDSFGFKGIVFAAGELCDFEQAGLAKNFAVSTSEFFYNALLGDFIITK